MRAVQDAVFSGKRSYSGVHIRAARQLLARQTQDNNATTSSVTETQSTTDLNDTSSTALVSTSASNSTSTLTSTSSDSASGLTIAAEPTSTTDTLSASPVSTTVTDSVTVTSTTESSTTSTESTSSTSTSSSSDSEPTPLINGGFAPADTPATSSAASGSAAAESTVVSTTTQEQPKSKETTPVTAQNGASNDSQGQDNQGQDNQGQNNDNGNQGGAQSSNDQQGSDNSGTTSSNNDQATDSSESSSSKAPAATAASANSGTNQGDGQQSNGNAGEQGQPQSTSSRNGGGNASSTSTSGASATIISLAPSNSDVVSVTGTGTSSLPTSSSGSEGSSSAAATSTGRIAGVTVGALALVAVISAILFFVFRRWRNRRDQVYDPEKRSGSPKRFTTQTINSFLGGPNTARLTVPATYDAPPQIYTQFDDRPISFVPSTTGSVPGAGMAIGSPSQMRTHTNLPGHDSLTVPIGPSTSGNPYSPSPSPRHSPASPASIEPGFEFVTPQPAMIQTVNAKNYGTASGSPTQSFNSQTIDYGYASPGIQRYSTGSDEVVISPQTQMVTQDPFRDQNPFSDPQQVRRGPGGGLWIQRPVQ